MSKAKHMPGEWRLGPRDNNEQRTVIGSDGQLVAVCSHECILSRVEEMEANACLIAAAPALLEACKAFDAYWRECARMWHENDGRVAETRNGAIVVGGNLDELGERASVLVIRAIAKAEGNDDRQEQGEGE